MIDIDHLSIDELVELNKRVVDRIKRLDEMQAQINMMAFNLGAKVSFDSKYGRQFGTVVKFNRKTVVVVTGGGRRWKVSPNLLSAVKDIDDSHPAAGQNQKRLK